MDSQASVLIAGDVWPTPIASDALAGRLRLAEPPELFLWTLDAAVAAGPTRPDYSCLPFPPAALDGLRLGRTTIAVTASNHITDFGDAGVQATLDALAARRFLHVGAGADCAQARRNLVVDLSVGRVAILAFAETEPRVSAIAARETSAGVRRLEADACVAAVRLAAGTADWVWVVLHSGEEYIRYPDPGQRQLAWKLVQAGASLVVNSHVHVPLGFERRGTGTIFYGLGNFVFQSYPEVGGYEFRWPPRSRQGVLAVGRFAAGHWIWEPREIRLSSTGLPRLGTHAHCPDYGRLLPATSEEYERLYPRLRRRERRQYVAQRLLWMTWQERVARFKRLFQGA